MCIRAYVIWAIDKTKEERKMTNQEKAEKYIEENQSPCCRTLREGAKYLVGKLTVYEIPHPVIWWEILKISRDIK
jgi:hypothetical protein